MTKPAPEFGNDPVDHPPHYLLHPSGVECITITEHMNFNVGNAVKYLWRAGSKGDVVEDLRKSAWYVEREIARVRALAGPREGVEDGRTVDVAEVATSPMLRSTVSPSSYGRAADGAVTA